MNKLRQFSPDEIAGLIQQWLDVFGKDRQGANTKAYMWHVFSGGRFPASEGDQALLEYGSQVSCEFVILSNDRDEAFLADARPEDRPFSDFYVFPPNLAWTMAFTHEEGWMGPYFARHPKYADLNAENLAKVKKQEEIAMPDREAGCSPMPSRIGRRASTLECCDMSQLLRISPSIPRPSP